MCTRGHMQSMPSKLHSRGLLGQHHLQKVLGLLLAGLSPSLLRNQQGEKNLSQKQFEGLHCISSNYTRY